MSPAWRSSSVCFLMEQERENRGVMSTRRRVPPASHHLTDDCIHLVPRERSQGLGADIPGCGEAQESCRRGLVIRGFADQYNVVVPQGPVDVLDRDPAPTSRLLEGVVALRGVLRRADALVSEAREHDEASHGDPPAPRPATPPATPEGTRILARIRRVADRRINRALQIRLKVARANHDLAGGAVPS